MFTKIYWIYHSDNAGRLGIMARPRGGDWLADEIASIKKQKVELLVSLLESEEVNELGLRQEETFCKDNSIEFISFPIADREVPKATDKVDWLTTYLAGVIQNGSSVVIHCRMGIGRSSLIAACILLLFGQRSDAIFVDISKVRGLKVPDTDSQVQWLKTREQKLRLISNCKNET
ncbi:dual specificity protein phosphatase family protein [Pinibacter soli]|uniref:Dual specificity protein phosphatase family protein n=1 Tax=Pinibacter soli TaxID=3044211 RepID=A0ABT6RGC5_9BACT|nr:dual specificity protein phosphatase family protein [Pinibacter soli]MDI3321610.1 dual specificity protein phosphatase family protein [Pinibacter soli]